MELAALAFLLIAMSRGGTPTATTAPPEGDHSSGGAAPQGDHGDDPLTTAGAVVTGVLGLVGALTTGGTAAVGGGAAAAAGSTAAVAGTTGGTAGAGSTAAGGGTAGLLTGAGGAAAGAGGAIEMAAIAAATSAALGVGIIVGVIMAFIIAKRIVDAQEIDKDWQGYLLNLNHNGSGLHHMESLIVEAYLQQRGRTFTVATLRDFRLDRPLPGSKLTFQGFRSVYRYIPAPDDLAALRRIRAFCLEYLDHRAWHAYRLMKNWNVVTPPADFGRSLNTLFHAYDPVIPPILNAAGAVVVPGAGGIMNIPHAAGGATLAPRRGADSEDCNDALQIVSREIETDISSIVLTDGEKRNAKFLALIEVMKVLKWDPRPAIEADRAWYAGEVLRALSWDGVAPPGLSHAGEAIEFDPEVFGTHFLKGSTTPLRFIHPAKIKLREGGWLT